MKNRFQNIAFLFAEYSCPGNHGQLQHRKQRVTAHGKPAFGILQRKGLGTTIGRNGNRLAYGCLGADIS